jgi:CelD/BcsL family acetyltransferase involved in cellulose biosynthesis
MKPPSPVLSGHLSVTPIDIETLSPTHLADWERLFADQPGPANPFLAPSWVLHWYRSYVAPADQLLLLLRRTATGELVGVAPFYVQHLRINGVPLAERLLPVGSGSTSPLELPGLLADAQSGREVTKALVAATMAMSPSWCEVVLAPAQCWFEPEWVFGTGQPVAFYDHQRPRACVVLPLEPTWDQTRSGLKRNVKESIRRSANRLKKDGRPWQVRARTGPDLDHAAIDRWLDLHRARAAAERATVHHHDAYADKGDRRFLKRLLPELAGKQLATLFELELDGQVVASGLALHAPGVSYVHSSGFSPDVWDLGPVALLHTEMVKHAISRGDTVVNFSPGPNVSKLRWSEQLWVVNDFVYGAGPTSLSWRYRAYLAASAVRSHVQAVAFARASSTAGPSSTAVPAPLAAVPALPAAAAVAGGRSPGASTGAFDSGSQATAARR